MHWKILLDFSTIQRSFVHQMGIMWVLHKKGKDFFENNWKNPTTLSLWDIQELLFESE